jgi:hypothetical protein
MPSSAFHKPRELRRRVVLPARLRTPAGWGDACILNLSSRGLLIHSSRALSEGTAIELLHGGHLISARVIWRDGSRIGLCADEKLPVDHILTVGQAASLHLAAPRRRTLDQRWRARLRGQSSSVSRDAIRQRCGDRFVPRGDVVRVG